MPSALDAIRQAAQAETDRAAAAQAAAEQHQLEAFFEKTEVIFSTVASYLLSKYALPLWGWTIDWPGSVTLMPNYQILVNIDVDAESPMPFVIRFDGGSITAVVGMRTSEVWRLLTVGGTLASNVANARDLLALAEAWRNVHPKPMGPGIYHVPGESQPPPLATEWFWQAGDGWAAVYAPWEEDTWWDGEPVPESVGVDEDVPVPWRRPITDIPTTGTLRWRDPAGFEIEVPAELALIRDGYQADVRLDAADPVGSQWCIYIEARGPQDYEGGDPANGAILGPYGETFFDDIHGGRTAALAHLERVRLAEQSDTTQS